MAPYFLYFKLQFVGVFDVTVGRGLAPAEILKEPKITKIFRL
jgi:hypothetical protein